MTVPARHRRSGPHQLTSPPTTGRSTVNGLTFHVLGAGYNPTVLRGRARSRPTTAYATESRPAASDAASHAQPARDDLVVVYPARPTWPTRANNPRGAYYENLIMASPVKLQGVGPGGFQGTHLRPGLDHRRAAPSAATPTWPPTGSPRSAGLTWDGNQAVNDGEAIYVLASQNATTRPAGPASSPAASRPRIDGFDIRGGDQHGFPGNINDLTGGPTGLPPNIITQGGAIFANAYARYLQITNNVVQNNGGGYGTIRIGTPDLPAPDTNQHNENVRIANNRIIDNAGTNLAGGIGLFAGADGYEVADNDICGNFSLEYGGGVSVYGRSPNGQIHHNRIYFNMLQRRGRRHHDRRCSCPADPGRRSRPAPAPWTSTPTRSRPTSPTTTAAASAS